MLQLIDRLDRLRSRARARLIGVANLLRRSTVVPRIHAGVADALAAPLDLLGFLEATVVRARVCRICCRNAMVAEIRRPPRIYASPLRRLLGHGMPRIILILQHFPLSVSSCK